MRIRTYDNLIKFSTWNERFRYLALKGTVAVETFGKNRFLNQDFYKSNEWRRIKDYVILRDNGCDLGIDGMEIVGPIYVHHMNPISEKDIIHQNDYLIDPNYLICTSFKTHNYIHYGSDETIQEDYIERKPFDTCPWR